MIDRRLQYVVSTARYGSFTAAAEHVGVTQSAITKSVADLEQQLGFQIFNRTTRGVIVTEEGSSFVKRASRLIEEGRDLLRGAAAGADPYAGALQIGICPPSLELLLVDPLTMLVNRHPKLRLHIVGGSYDRIVQDLRTGAVDVAFGYDAAFNDQPDFQRPPAPPIQSTLFVRKGHPILECKDVTLAEMAKYDLISPSGSAPYNAAWRAIYEESDVEVRDRIHVIDCFPLVTRLVRSSDILGITSTHYTQTSVFKRHFEAVHAPHLFKAAPLCFATRLRWKPRPAVRAFMKACREYMPSARDAAEA
ncbi:MAG: LysR family transcriptional regulator [Alphaproteobacteria bacterium HGW-Alphaproteobacteria-12]|nr:MAG: LysR family transcriptional regulator [Alphaproteobacteria bacterium HGW-Alphaproteobacteria-12]